MLAPLGEPKADGFETGGRVYSAGLPSMRDPVRLTAELVLLKGCLKGPEPKTPVVMFVWLKEEQHSKASLKRTVHSQSTGKKMRWVRVHSNMDTCSGKICRN